MGKQKQITRLGKLTLDVSTSRTVFNRLRQTLGHSVSCHTRAIIHSLHQEAGCPILRQIYDEQLQSNLYPALARSQRAIQLNCKPVASYFLSGRGIHGSGRNHHQTPQEYVDTHNLSFLHPRSVTRNSPPGHLKSGVVKEDVELAIEMCMEKECLSI